MLKQNVKESESNPFDYGLRSRLLLLLVVMLLPFIAFSLYHSYYSYHQLLRDKIAENKRDAVEVANNVDELIQSTADLLVALSYSQHAQEQNFGELKKWFNNIAAKYPYYKNIIFVDLDGNIRAAAYTYTKPDGEVIANVKKTAYYERSINSNDLAYGDFMYAILSKEPVIHISYPVYKNSERLGFVAIAFDLTRLQKRVVTSNISEGSEISVFDQNGTVIARSLDPQRWVGQCFKTSNIFTAAQQGSENITAPGPDGITRVMSFQKISKAPWFITVCYDKDTLRSQALGELLKQMGLFIPLLLVAVGGWLWISRDVDILYKAARRLSLTDPMTSLGSFQKFNHDLSKDIAKARRQMQPLSLLLISIDNFKQFNEDNGYQYGNRALLRVADIVRNSLRDTDFAYRYGVNEISLLITATDELDAQEFAERIRDKISQAKFLTKSGQDGELKISIGITTYPLDASDGDGLVKCAADALLEAKESSDGNIVTYSQTLRPSRAIKGG